MLRTGLDKQCFRMLSCGRYDNFHFLNCFYFSRNYLNSNCKVLSFHEEPFASVKIRFKRIPRSMFGLTFNRTYEVDEIQIRQILKNLENAF